MESSNKKIEIQFSKTKIALLLVGAIVFVVFGVFFIITPETFVFSILRNQEIIQIVGITTVVFSGLSLVSIARKLFDNKVGLSIDKNGITDNSNATSVGLIEWDDITGIRKVQVASTNILMLQTDKPEKYIDRAKNVTAKLFMKVNHRMYGSPLSIVSNSLKMNFDDLERMITAEFEKRKK